MNESDFYWPTYKNIEHEVLDLASRVLFNDQQMSVYSPYIADLIIRCSTEVESISKTLYRSLGGQDPLQDCEGNTWEPYFDTDCINLLVSKWHVDEKRFC